MVSGIRFGGLASGMDTEGMVKQLMQSERIRVDKFTQQKLQNNGNKQNITL